MSCFVSNRAHIFGHSRQSNKTVNNDWSSYIEPSQGVYKTQQPKAHPATLSSHPRPLLYLSRLPTKRKSIPPLSQSQNLFFRVLIATKRRPRNKHAKRADDPSESSGSRVGYLRALFLPFCFFPWLIPTFKVKRERA